jgi:hypothetical protein
MPTPNVIKYSATLDPKSLKVGNFSLGVSNSAYGETSSTGYWNGYNIQPDTLVVYQNKASNGPSIRVFQLGLPDFVNWVNSSFNQNFPVDYPEFAYNYVNGLGSTILVDKSYPEIVTSGLTLHLDGGFMPSYPQSGSTWTDLSFSANNCTLANSPNFATTFGGHFVFDGTNNTGNAGSNSSLDITGNVTVAAWVRPFSFTNLGNIISKNGNQGYRMRFQSNGSFWMYSNGNTITSPSTYAINNWWYTVGVFSSTGLRMYVNGSLVQSNSTPFSPSYATSSFFVGGFSATQELFHGRFASVSVYNRALNDTEILNNYNNQKSRFGL